MITTAPKKEFALDYPINKVKQAINSTLRLAGHRLLNSNETLNTYSLALVYSLNTAILNIQLIQIEGSKTRCIFEVLNTGGSRIQPATLSGMMDKYLLTFTNLLTGKTVIVEKTPAQVKKEGKKILIYLIAGVIIMILLFVIAHSISK